MSSELLQSGVVDKFVYFTVIVNNYFCYSPSCLRGQNRQIPLFIPPDSPLIIFIFHFVRDTLHYVITSSVISSATPTFFYRTMLYIARTMLSKLSISISVWHFPELYQNV